MTHYYLIEPLVEGKYWSGLYLEGMRRTAKLAKSRLERLQRPEDAGRGAHVILNGISQGWFDSNAQRLLARGAAPIAIGAAEIPGCSFAAFDFYGAYLDFFAALRAEGRCRTALFGVIPGNVNDVCKVRAFRKIFGTDKGIYYNRGDFSRLLEEFAADCGDYDSLAAVNDVVLTGLASYLEKIGAAKNFRFASAVSTAMWEGRDSLIYERFDCAAVGGEAVRLSSYLARHPQIRCLRALIRGKTAKEELGGEKAEACREAVDFYRDETVQRLFLLERTLRALDGTDRKILGGILARKPYVRIAAELYLTEAAVKYRVRRLCRLCGAPSARALCGFLLPYLE